MTSIVHTTSKSLDYPLVDDRPCVLKKSWQEEAGKISEATKSLV